MPLVGSVIAAVAIALGLSLATQPLLVADSLAARSEPGEASGMTADASGRWGCVSAPTPTPTPTPTPSPVAGVPAGVASRSGLTAFAAGADVPTGATQDAAPPGIAGIDISRYQLKVDLRAARDAGIRFVFTKATQGTGILDPWYERHVAAARSASMPVGSYHFFDYRKDGVAQADWFVKAMRQADADMRVLPPVVDVECLESMGRADRPYVREQLRAFVDRVYKRTGRIVMIYTSMSMWDKVTGGDATFGGHPLWVACWDCTTPRLPAGWSTWTFWQHGPRKLPDGRKVDGNVFGGSSSALARLTSRPMVVAGGAATTRSGPVALELRGVDGVSIRTTTSASGGWGPWRSRSAAAAVTLTGSKTANRSIRVQGRDARGTTGLVMSDSIRLEVRTPTPATSRTTKGKVVIPKVRGLTKAQARAAIKKAGLRVKASVRKVSNGSVAKGRVVNTYPSYRKDGKPRKLPRGTAIQIKVSTGR
jgi:lysozyme